MKFSIGYVKQHPTMFAIIAIVFWLLFYFIIRRGQLAGDTSSGASYVDAGPSEMEISAQTQVALAQIQASTVNAQSQAQVAALAQQGQNDLALGVLGSQVQLASIAADERATNIATTASLEALHYQLDTERAITEANNQFQIGYARVAADSAAEQVRIGAALQTTLAAQQLQAYQTGAFVGALGSLKKKDRDNIIVNPQFAGIFSRAPVTPTVQ